MLQQSNRIHPKCFQEWSIYTNSKLKYLEKISKLVHKSLQLVYINRTKVKDTQTNASIWHYFWWIGDDKEENSNLIQLLVDDEASKSLTASFLCAFFSNNSANLGYNDTFLFLNP